MRLPIEPRITRARGGGVYQHRSSKHLQRYLYEFDFRYTYRIANGNEDAARTAEALKGARGKRLMYRQPAVAAV